MEGIYIIYDENNNRLGQASIRRQAECAALGYAKSRNQPTFVDRVLSGRETRRVQFSPDGTLVLLWNGGEVWQGVLA